MSTKKVKTTTTALPDIEAAEPEALTVNGKPIPDEFAHAIPYAMTDQGIAARQTEGRLVAYTEMVRDHYDKQTDRRNACEVWESEEPMREIVESVHEPGMGYRFLSPRTITKRGMRKYEVVKDAKGDDVKLGNMVLGKMPLELQARRAKHYQDLGNAELAQAHENLRVTQEQIARDNPGWDSTLRDGAVLADRGYSGATGDVHEIGVHRNRGQADHA